MQIFVKTLTGKTITAQQISLTSRMCCKRCTSLSGRHQHQRLINDIRDRFGWDPDFAYGLVKEYIRFLELKCCMKDWKCRKIYPSPLIDKVWAESLNDTHGYHQLCKSIHKSCNASGSHHFIHRISKKTGGMKSTKIAYEARFCNPPSEKYWASDAIEVLMGELPPCDCLCGFIQQTEGIPVDQMRLIFAGRQIDQSKTLAEWGLTKESTVHLCLRLGGC